MSAELQELLRKVAETSVVRMIELSPEERERLARVNQLIAPSSEQEQERGS